MSAHTHTHTHTYVYVGDSQILIPGSLLSCRPVNSLDDSTGLSQQAGHIPCEVEVTVIPLPTLTAFFVRGQGGISRIQFSASIMREEFGIKKTLDPTMMFQFSFL